MPRFFNFSRDPSPSRKNCVILLAATSNHVQVRLDCTIDIHSNISKGLLYFAKWFFALFAKRNEMKSALCEMKICTLRNGNLYLAKWKSILCEMEIYTLRNGNLYFARWKSVLREIKICTLRNETLTQ